MNKTWCFILFLVTTGCASPLGEVGSVTRDAGSIEETGSGGDANAQSASDSGSGGAHDAKIGTNDDAGTGNTRDATGGSPDDAAGGGDSSGADTSPPGYAAPHPPLPQVINYGGRVLANPKLVPVYWSNDPLASQLNGFLSKVGQSSYWSELTQYGVGPATLGTPIMLTEAPPASLNDVAGWLTGKVNASGTTFVPDDDTLYVLYLPASTISSSGCAFYHDNVVVAATGQSAPYAVLPRCNTDAQNMALVSSHELVEAATDPDPATKPGYLSDSATGLSWAQAVGGGEIADLCVLSDMKDNWLQVPDLPGWTVHQYWSNRAAAASHDPCFPTNAALYFNAVPVLPSVILSNGYEVDAVAIPVGQSKTIELDLFSDVPTAPFAVAASQGTLTTDELGFALDSSSGANGDKLKLTITLKKAPVTNDFAIFLVTSTLNGENRYSVGAVIADTTKANPCDPQQAACVAPSP